MSLLFDLNSIIEPELIKVILNLNGNWLKKIDNILMKIFFVTCVQFLYVYESFSSFCFRNRFNIYN